MNNRDFLLAFVFIAVGFIYRIIPLHLQNFTPIAAMALVGGMYMNKKVLAFIVPIAALFLSDLILNNFIFKDALGTTTGGLVLWADYMFFTYGAMIITVLIGMALSAKSIGSKILGGTLSSSIVFYMLADFGSWLSLPIYTKNFGGLVAAYVAGFPYFLMTLLGTLVFSIVFIGTIEYLKKGQTEQLSQKVSKT